MNMIRHDAQEMHMPHAIVQCENRLFDAPSLVSGEWRNRNRRMREPERDEIHRPADLPVGEFATLLGEHILYGARSL